MLELFDGEAEASLQRCHEHVWTNYDRLGIGPAAVACNTR